MTESVTIVGGGLAGMSAALRLLERGFKVTILEASERLGGKAGADAHGSDFDEHGWHLFPLWYVNIWKLVDELGIRGNFVDKTRYAYMEAGKYPNLKYLENPFSPKTVFHNLFNGIIDPVNSFLYQYTGLALMSQSVARRAQLDQVTVNGFARARFYCDDTVVDQLEDTVSRASAIESFEMSAMTVRNVMRFWLRYNSPWFRILNGNLHSKWILPIETRLRELGCDIQLGVKVTGIDFDGRRARAVRTTGARGEGSAPVETLLLTTPALDTRQVLDGSCLSVIPQLGGVFYLRSRIMAGITIYFKKRIEGVPPEHTNFIGSPYAQSMIDVTDVWGEKDRSVISIVASDYTTLQSLPEADAQRILIDDLRRYLPFLHEEDIDRVAFQPHIAQPLFANTAGAWPRRPTATTDAENIFMAGDYCQSHVDLTCMEGAVSTGLMAAEAIRAASGSGAPIAVLQPETYPNAYMILLKVILFPPLLIAAAIARFRRDK